MASNDETKIYPGSVERYRELRKLRESLGSHQDGESAELHSVDTPAYFAAVVAEEMAGLAYILDGIRYSARAK